MTHRHDLEQHRTSLAEIRDIMNSMKTLAFMETRKLARYLDAQRAVVGTIETAAADLISAHPEVLPPQVQDVGVYILVGSERGFCADYNRSVLERMASLREPQTPGVALLLVGRKLEPMLEGDARVAAVIDGAGVAEEIGSVLGEIVHELAKLQAAQPGTGAFCVYHENEDTVVFKRLLPAFQQLSRQAPLHPHPPVLNQPPHALLAELSEHYLFAVLHEILCTSLMAENYKRVTHLEGAVNHLDKEAEELSHRCNALRQEEIIEEIEVLLLSTGSP